MDTKSLDPTAEDDVLMDGVPAADTQSEDTGQGSPGARSTGMSRYEIYVEKSEQPLAAEAELSKAMALAAAATASFGLVKIFSEKSHRVIATYSTNRKGEPILI